MAAWQFDVTAVGPDGSTALSPEIRISAEAFLAGIMRPNIESKGWTQYGTDRGNRIDLLFDAQSCEIEMRIDARAAEDTFLDLVCLLMMSLGCTLLATELDERIKPDIASLKAALMNSAAWRYAVGSSPQQS